MQDKVLALELKVAEHAQTIYQLKAERSKVGPQHRASNLSKSTAASPAASVARTPQSHIVKSSRPSSEKSNKSARGSASSKYHDHLLFRQDMHNKMTLAKC